MAFEKNDFVEIQFTGKVKDGDVFDSNIKEDLKLANIQGQDGSFIFPIGNLMFVQGVDEFLIGKDVGEYNVSLNPEKAFGRRDPKLIQMIPMKVFLQHRINPIPGAMFNFDGKLAKVLTVSSGRVMVDFNHPLSGKNVEYKIIVKRKVDDLNEKINAMNDFFFRNKLEFEVKGKELNLKVQKGMKPFVEMFNDKYKEVLDLDLKAEEIEKK